MVNDNRKGIAEHWTRNMIEEARVDRRAPWQTSRLAVLLLHQVLHDTKISRRRMWSVIRRYRSRAAPLAIRGRVGAPLLWSGSRATKRLLLSRR